MDHIIDSGWSPNMVFSPRDCTIRWFFVYFGDLKLQQMRPIRWLWSKLDPQGFCEAVLPILMLDISGFWENSTIKSTGRGDSLVYRPSVLPPSASNFCLADLRGFHVTCVCCLVWLCKGLLGDMPSLLVFSILTIVQQWSDRENHYNTTNHIELFQTNVLPQTTPQKAQECLYQCHLCLDLESAVLFFTRPASFWKMCLCTKYQMNLNRSLQTCSCIVANDSHKIRNAAIFWDICVYLYLLVAPPHKNHVCLASCCLGKPSSLLYSRRGGVLGRSLCLANLWRISHRLSQTKNKKGLWTYL